MQNLAALRKLIVNRLFAEKLCLSFIVLLFFLFTFHFSLFPTAAQAADPPNPLPCQNPIVPSEEILTYNWLVNENREPPTNLQGSAGAIGPEGASVSVTTEFTFQVDFSKLGAIFGPTNSNYLEGKFQSQEHKTVDVVGLDPTSFSTYHGSEEKAAPKAMLDQLRVKTVKYIYEHPELGESGDMFTDVNGDNPRTIYEMRRDFGIPDPDTQRGTDSWQNGWGKYWAKIPTAYSEFYEAYIEFREESNSAWIGKVKNREYCPDLFTSDITFVMPEFFRTTATSGQLNQVIVPSAAQSDHSNDLILQNGDNSSSQSKNILAKVIETCLKFFKNNPLSNSLKKVISFSIQLLNPVKNAYAEENRSGDPPDCIRILREGKEGQDPYCALPANQPLPMECTNQTDSLKLNPDNPNVICTFTIVWQKDMVLSAGSGENQFDSCTPLPSPPYPPNWVSCSVKVFVWPVFKIPWLAEIWNNTLFSDTPNNEPFIGSPLQQEKGRPGVYSFFTPKTIFNSKIDDLILQCQEETDSNSEACRELLNEGSVYERTYTHYYGDQLKLCYEQFGLPGIGGSTREQLVACVKFAFETIGKKRPGETDTSTEDDLKRRFIGGTDCSKEFVWHNALYPLAAQRYYGITNACPVNAAAQPPGAIIPPPGPAPPGGIDTLNYYIKYGDISIGIDPVTRAQITAMASSWQGNNIGQWDYVVSQSIARGVSPAFTIAIWMEEGGFGGAGALDQFGMVRCSQHDLISSLNCFLDFTTRERPYNSADPYNSFYNWVNYFCGPNRVYICGPSLTDPSDSNENFIPNLEWAITTVNPDAIEYVGNI